MLSNLDLTSVLAKLGRADEHRQTVEGEIRRWSDSKPYMITREHNADFTRHSLVAHIAADPPLVRWTLIFGDAIHNLRTALDHLVYAIAVAESGKNPPPDEVNLMFPVCEDCPEFTKAERRRLMTLSEKARLAIEAHQPYHRKHPEFPPLLSVLNELERADKHRLLNVAFSSPAHGEVGFVGPPMDGLQVKYWANPEEIKDGSELVVYTCNRPTPDYKFDRFLFLMIVCVKHALGPSNKDRTEIPSLLHLLHEEVRYIVEQVSNAVLR